MPMTAMVPSRALSNTRLPLKPDRAEYFCATPNVVCPRIGGWIKSLKRWRPSPSLATTRTTALSISELFVTAGAGVRASVGGEGFLVPRRP
jgi:hypothetical protein